MSQNQMKPNLQLFVHRMGTHSNQKKKKRFGVMAASKIHLLKLM